MARKLKEPVRQQAILSKLRDGIIRGALPPGARLSTRLQLAEEFDTTVITVQRALTKLSQEGFVTASGSRGTFVSENPPHLSHYGLVFPYRPEFPGAWSGLARAMSDAAFALERTQARRLSIYYYTGYELHKTDDYDRLVEGVVNHTVAGLIFVQSPFRMRKTPVLQAPGIPRVAIMSESALAGVDAVYVDWNGFYDRALDYLHARGRRRVAIISRERKTLNDYVCAAVARRGMELRPYAWQSSSDEDGDWPKYAAHALLHNRQLERPDALIIGEDVYVNPACAGIVASGAVVERDLDVVAHCNYPAVPAKVLPIKILGFDSQRLLQTCIDHIDRARRGESAPNITLIPAQFEEDIKQLNNLRQTQGVSAAGNALFKEETEQPTDVPVLAAAGSI